MRVAPDGSKPRVSVTVHFTLAPAVRSTLQDVSPVCTTEMPLPVQDMSPLYWVMSVPGAPVSLIRWEPALRTFQNGVKVQRVSKVEAGELLGTPLNRYGTTLGGMLDQVYARSPYLALRDLAEHDSRYRTYLPSILRRRYRSRKAKALLSPPRAPRRIRSG